MTNEFTSLIDLKENRNERALSLFYIHFFLKKKHIKKFLLSLCLFLYIWEFEFALHIICLVCAIYKVAHAISIDHFFLYRFDIKKNQYSIFLRFLSIFRSIWFLFAIPLILFNVFFLFFYFELFLFPLNHLITSEISCSNITSYSQLHGNCMEM